MMCCKTWLLNLNMYRKLLLVNKWDLYTVLIMYNDLLVTIIKCFFKMFTDNYFYMSFDDKKIIVNQIIINY